MTTWQKRQKQEQKRKRNLDLLRQYAEMMLKRQREGTMTRERLEYYRIMARDCRLGALNAGASEDDVYGALAKARENHRQAAH